MYSIDDTKRMHAVFSGHVQGVGFRFTACRIAGRFSVAGYVRNLADGDVELVAEGSPDELSAFRRAIHESPLSRHIRREKLEWRTAKGEFDGFGILV